MLIVFSSCSWSLEHPPATRLFRPVPKTKPALEPKRQLRYIVIGPNSRTPSGTSCWNGGNAKPKPNTLSLILGCQPLLHHQIPISYPSTTTMGSIKHNICFRLTLSLSEPHLLEEKSFLAKTQTPPCCLSLSKKGARGPGPHHTKTNLA